MMARQQIGPEMNDVSRDNSHTVRSMRFLFLALNDVAGFEREVLKAGNKSRHAVEVNVNPTDQECSGLN
jgi:hypothetical protein